MLEEPDLHLLLRERLRISSPKMLPSSGTPVFLTSVLASLKYCDNWDIWEMSQEFAYKQALIIRLDLKIGGGKIAVQGSHAAVSAAEEARIRFAQSSSECRDEGN